MLGAKGERWQRFVDRAMLFDAYQGGFVDRAMLFELARSQGRQGRRLFTAISIYIYIYIRFEA